MRTLSLLVLLAACGMPMELPDGGVDAGFSPKLANVPDCGTPDDAGFAQDIFDLVVVPTGCNAGGCHGPPDGLFFSFNDAASMRAAWVDQKSGESPRLQRITPGKPDESYVLYKLYGQQLAAGGLGDQMPQGGPFLGEAQLCAITNWVRAGAR